VCVKRCPVGALTEQSYDGHTRYALGRENAAKNQQPGRAIAKFTFNSRDNQNGRKTAGRAKVRMPSPGDLELDPGGL
jgi:hypothetical protein